MLWPQHIVQRSSLIKPGYTRSDTAMKLSAVSCREQTYFVESRHASWGFRPPTRYHPTGGDGDGELEGHRRRPMSPANSTTSSTTGSGSASVDDELCAPAPPPASVSPTVSPIVSRFARHVSQQRQTRRPPRSPVELAAGAPAGSWEGRATGCIAGAPTSALDGCVGFRADGNGHCAADDFAEKPTLREASSTGQLATFNTMPTKSMDHADQRGPSPPPLSGSRQRTHHPHDQNTEPPHTGRSFLPQASNPRNQKHRATQARYNYARGKW